MALLLTVLAVGGASDVIGVGLLGFELCWFSGRRRSLCSFAPRAL